VYSFTAGKGFSWDLSYSTFGLPPKDSRRRRQSEGAIGTLYYKAIADGDPRTIWIAFGKTHPRANARGCD
jgi:hypothetical protein